MISPPRKELLVFGEDRINQLIQHVIGRLTEELRVRVQRLVVLAIEPRDVPYELFAAGSCFDDRHERLLY